MKKLLSLAITLGMVLWIHTSAFAALTLLDDFTFYTQTGNKYIDNIDLMQYLGYSHVNITDGDANGLDEGDTFSDAIVFKIGSGDFHNDDTGIVDTYRDSTGIGVGDFELTGFATLTGTHTALTSPVAANYVFDTATLNIYFDAANNASKVNGAGSYTDGTLIATFTLLSGGGNFDFTNLDGNIDVDFLKTSMLPGYFFAKDGTDLSILDPVAAMTDSNSDAMPGGVAVTLPNNWTSVTGQPIGGDAFDLNLEVDGSARFGVPEPTSLALLGMGLLGLAGFRRKKIG